MTTEPRFKPGDFVVLRATAKALVAPADTIEERAVRAIGQSVTIQVIEVVAITDCNGTRTHYGCRRTVLPDGAEEKLVAFADVELDPSP